MSPPDERSGRLLVHTHTNTTHPIQPTPTTRAAINDTDVNLTW